MTPATIIGPAAAAMPFIGLMVPDMKLIWSVPWFAVWLQGLIAQ